MRRYVIYKCKECKKHTILIRDEVDHSEKAGVYMTCGHDGRHRDLVVTGAYDNIEECMEEANTYRRVRGRVRQER